MDSVDPRWAATVERWRGATPWLSGLYVVPAARGRGAGTRLADACEAEARRAGVGALHLHTATARGFFDRRGYVALDRVSYEGEVATVMRKPL
jgi:N-acetylglutamate synthase-like GNAT family acetyltransferase